jgi:DNA-binding CsgD family transcriptional regulator
VASQPPVLQSPRARRSRTRRDPRDPSRLLPLIESVYAAALDSSRWPDALVRITDHFEARTTIVYGQRAFEDRMIFSMAVGSEQSVIDAFEQYYVHRDVRIPAIARLREGDIRTDQDLLPAGELQASEIYNDFLTKVDLPHVMGGSPIRTNAGVVTFGVNRSALVGPFRAAEIDAAHVVFPHLSRAVTLATRLQQGRWLEAAGWAGLDRLPCGALLVAEDLRIIECNGQARSILGSASWARSREGRLQLIDANAQSALRRCVAQVCASGRGLAPLAGLGGAVTRRCVVVPLPAHELSFLGRLQGALVLLFDDEHSPRPRAERVRDALGLSRAEARVVAALAAGLPLRAIAEQRQLSIHTVRDHVKRALSKTGLRSQAALIRAVLTGPGGLDGD